MKNEFNEKQLSKKVKIHNYKEYKGCQKSDNKWLNTIMTGVFNIKSLDNNGQYNYPNRMWH